MPKGKGNYSFRNPPADKILKKSSPKGGKQVNEVALTKKMGGKKNRGR